MTNNAKTYRGHACPKGHNGTRFIETDACVQCWAAQKKPSSKDLYAKIKTLKATARRRAEDDLPWEQRAFELELEVAQLRHDIEILERRVREVDSGLAPDEADLSDLELADELYETLRYSRQYAPALDPE